MVLYQSRHDTTKYGRLAQLVEHLLDVQEVTGSSPVPSTTNPQTNRFGDFFNGVVVFEAKTDELEQHYIRDFGARPVASLYPDGPKTFMIADQAAKDIFSSYLF